MELVRAQYVGLDGEDLWIKVAVDLKIGSRIRHGFLLFENDGRDLEIEGELEPFSTLIMGPGLEAIYKDPEQENLLVAELEKGREALERSRA